MRNVKSILFLLASFCSLATYGQKMTLEEWNSEAKTNIRLFPKYGHVPKTEGQLAADKSFLEITLKETPVRREASDKFIELGFKYLYRDVKTAMYRFNQAYLLDSTNPDIYWGYGAIYMTLGDMENAQKQYLEGLSVAPKSSHLLTDYGTYFMSQYYLMQPIDKKQASTNLDSAITYLTNSYYLDSKDPNTAFKLSVCYYQQKDCKNAWKYYDECKALGGQPITDDYTKDLEALCQRK